MAAKSVEFLEEASAEYEEALDWYFARSRPPHPARLPMKCIGTAGHPLPQGGEG